MTTTLKLTEIKHTLVMPAFNEEEKIERSINKVVSFLRNNLDEFEVIISPPMSEIIKTNSHLKFENTFPVNVLSCFYKNP